MMRQNRKILIVDDNPENIEILVDYIESTNLFFDVIVASNGIKALEILDKSLVDIIIMDWQMPELDGIETLKRLKKNEKLKEIPVIIITAMMITVQDLSYALENGAIDFLKHPINKIELLARIKSAMTISNYLAFIKLQEKVIAQNEKELLLKGVEQLKNELMLKKEDFYKLSVQIIDSDSQLENFVKDLIRILNVVNDDSKEYVTNMLNKYKEQMLNAKPNVEEKLKQINDNFYEKLIKKFPNLTLNEKKLSTFLKMNLTTKEISNLTLRSEESIKKARLRLRLKLNVPKSVSIHNFFDVF